ncbi:hypothetical protein RHGRI_018132 [Rhododendron griersonianum]|uniref:Pectinesterase inhibitor domain-containing protein n=1 Tax=Rhododendron griersonianum TaxID=479676 RepID=A0AAV6K0H1_9ERIC|nr:hypothetical protein RHGRI_018132 [Rhododendron griersonianum]
MDFSCSRSSSLMVYLLLVLLFNGSSSQPSDLARTICLRTVNANLCLQIFNSDPRSATADVKGLSLIAIDASEASANQTLNTLGSLFNSTPAASLLKDVYQTCTRNYEIVISKLETAKNLLLSPNYKSASGPASDATNGTPNHRSHGSSNNNDMGSTTNNAFTKPIAFNDQPMSKSGVNTHPSSAFQPIPNGHVQVQHHHHHYHHDHHHVHNMKQEQKQQPNHDDLSLRTMVKADPQCGPSNVLNTPIEGNAANYTLNGSASGSKNGSNEQNGNSPNVINEITVGAFN